MRVRGCEKVAVNVTTGKCFSKRYVFYCRIHDFKQGLQFNIDLDRGNCTTAPLVASFYFDVKAVNETHVRMDFKIQ